MRTIRFFSVFLIALVVTLSASAQYMSIGPSLGAGISSITGKDDVVDINPQFSWNGGVTFVYSTKAHFGFGADLKYSSEGYGFNLTDLSGTPDSFDTHVHLNYLRLPVRGIYFFGEYGGTIRPKVFLGLTPGILLSAKTKSDAGDFDVKDDLNSFDLGLQGGVGLNIKLAEAIWLNTDLSIYQGLLDIGKDTENSNLNQNVGINIGVAFGFGGE